MPIRRTLICLIVLVNLTIHPTPGRPAAEKSAAGAEETTAKVLPLAPPTVSRHELALENRTLAYTATAGVLPVHLEGKRGEPDSFECRIFFVGYELASGQEANRRPLTFVFNGGPGAASAYLHLGALGPRRISWAGARTGAPAGLTDNAETWLEFTDLVFIDPVGTGYSRCVNGRSVQSKPATSDGQRGESAAWGVREDLDAIAAFIRLYLTRYERWPAARFLVGESYGGFRAAALADLMRGADGIAFDGIALVSPVLQFSLLRDDPYRVMPWITTVPSYAATARYHGKAAGELPSKPGQTEFLEEVEKFTIEKLLPVLASGDGAALADALSLYVGLPAEEIARLRARIPASFFAKRLLRQEERIVSLYDGSFTAIDPNPGRPLHRGEDPLLSHLNAALTTAFNSYVRRELRFETDIPYELLNRTVSRQWNWQSGIDGQQGFVGVADNLKDAMSADGNLRVLLAHGVFDLVTPYFASEIVTRQMSLDSAVAPNLSLRVYEGGHMFYRREASRRGFRDDAARELYSGFLPTPQ